MSDIHSEIRKPRPGSIAVSVSDEGTPAVGARISVYDDPAVTTCPPSPGTVIPSADAVVYDAKSTGADGCALFHNVPAGVYVVTYDHYPEDIDAECVEVESGCVKDVCFKLKLGASAVMDFFTDDCKPLPCPRPRVGDRAEVRIEFGCAQQRSAELSMTVATPGYSPTPGDDFSFSGVVTQAGPQSVDVSLVLPGRTPAAAGGAAPPPAPVTPAALLPMSVAVDALEQCIGPTITGNVGVTMRRSRASATNTFALWTAIRNRTKAISFSGSGYKTFIDRVLCQNEPPPDVQKSAVLKRQVSELSDHVYGTAAYDLLKTATEVFLLLECGLEIRKQGAPPNDTRILDLEYESKVWGQAVNLQFLEEQLRGYLGGKALPYIERVIAAAFPGQKKVGSFANSC